MKSVPGMLLAGAVVALAFAVSIVPSQAQKKKATAACEPFSWCSTECKGNSCRVHSCEGGKWIPSVLGTHCAGTNCPPKCPKR